MSEGETCASSVVAEAVAPQQGACVGVTRHQPRVVASPNSDLGDGCDISQYVHTGRRIEGTLRASLRRQLWDFVERFSHCNSPDRGFDAEHLRGAQYQIIYSLFNSGEIRSILLFRGAKVRHDDALGQ